MSDDPESLRPVEQIVLLTNQIQWYATRLDKVNADLRASSAAGGVDDEHLDLDELRDKNRDILKAVANMLLEPNDRLSTYLSRRDALREVDADVTGDLYKHLYRWDVPEEPVRRADSLTDAFEFIKESAEKIESAEMPRRVRIMFAEIHGAAEDALEILERSRETTDGVEEIRKERIRQIEVHDYDEKHDRQHQREQLTRYAFALLLYHVPLPIKHFDEWKRGQPDWILEGADERSDDYEEALRAAGALIAAELDRISD